ncbi:MAG: hypothetical protein KC657_37415 [Myxococcales bacterium]|nr:hypothetical protein [Myxococcales bacterium]
MSDIEACTITIREGEVGSEPEPVVRHFASPQATHDAYDALIHDLWHERDFVPADEAFMSCEPVAVDGALIARIEEAFAGVPRGRIGIREAGAIDLRLAEHDAEYVSARDEDRETDWRDIPNEVLAHDPSVFPHLDDQGFKFVLPAVMRWTVAVAFDRFLDRWTVSRALLFFLLDGDSPARLARRWELSPRQVAVVVAWLDAYLGSKMLRDANDVERVERWRTLASTAE